MRRMLILVMTLVLVAGCCGTNSLKVTTIPVGAKLYANGNYVGLTPCNAPAKWNFLWSNTVRLKMEKSGYEPMELNVSTEECRSRERKGDCEKGSEFGKGDTFPYTFNLEKKVK